MSGWLRNQTWSKYSKILMVVMLFAMVTACSKQMEQEKSLFIKPSEFSAETQEILKIMEDEIYFFDYSVDETIKSMRIDIWAYENGAWTGTGNTYGNLEHEHGRIAFRMNDATYDIFEFSETGHVKTSYKSTVDFDECVTKIASTLQHSTEIKPGKEIVLSVKLGYNTLQAVSPGATSYFREADCDRGLAVTAIFSTETVE